MLKNGEIAKPLDPEVKDEESAKLHLPFIEIAL